MPNKSQIINSDIAKYAVESNCYWEKLFEVNVDKLTCRSYEIPLQDDSVDLVFAFQAAHHFIKHKSTLKDIYRLLKRGGTCLYLNEPSCNKLLYHLAYRRVNKKRPSVPEDVLIHSELLTLAKNVGFNAMVYYDTKYNNRGPIATIYYYALSKIAFLKYIFPCGMDYIFKKP